MYMVRHDNKFVQLDERELIRYLIPYLADQVAACRQVQLLTLILSEKTPPGCSHYGDKIGSSLTVVPV